MHARLSRFGAIAAAVGFLCGLPRLLGDEPPKPTASATEANPAVPAPGHSVHGEAVQRRAAARRLPDARHGQVPLPGHHQEARGAGVHRPGGRAAPFVLSTSRPSGRSARPPGSTRTAPWPTGAWRCRTSTTPSAPGSSSRRPASGPPSRSPGASSSISRPWRRSTRRATTPGTTSRTCSRGSRRSSRSSPTTSTPAPGWRWSPGSTAAAGSAAGRRSTSCSTRCSRSSRCIPGAHHYRIHLWDGVKPIRAEKSAALLRQDRAGDRARLAHARPHLHRAQAVRRRGLPAGGLGPGRPRLHVPRPGHAVRDPQLRPQQPVALHQLQPHRPGARRDRRGAEPGRAAPRPAEERPQRRRLAAAAAAGSAGPRSSPATSSGTT